MQRATAREATQRDEGEAFFAARGLPLRHDRPPFSPDDWPVVVPRGEWDRTPRGPWLRLIALRRVPLFYHPIEKAGCTFIKNLLWMIEWGEPYAPGPLNIHQNGDMAFDRIYVDPARGAPLQGLFFTCAREPLSRFLSAYFDKFVGCAPEFEHVRRIAANGFGFDPNPPATVAAHRENLVRCLRFIRAQMAFNHHIYQGVHYLPQLSRLRQVKQIGGDIILLESLENHLHFLLDHLVSGFTELSPQLRDATHSVPRLFSTEELVDSGLEAEIYAVYRSDKNIYEDLVRRWRRRMRLSADGSRPSLYD